MPSNHITDIYHYENDMIIVGTTKGARILKNGKFVNNELQKKLIQYDRPVNSINSSGKQLCLSTYRGELLLLNNQEEIIIDSKKHDLYLINHVLIDREGVIWVCTESKLTALYTSPFVEYRFDNNKQEVVNAICSDKNGSIHYINNYGLFNIENDSIVKISDFRSLSILFDTSSNYYFLDQNHGLYQSVGKTVKKIEISLSDTLFNPKFSKNPSYRGFWIDKDNIKWIGFKNILIAINDKNEMIYLYDKNSGLKKTGGIQVLYRDLSGNMWIGCGNGLFCLKDDKIFKIEKTYDNSIYSIREDEIGNVWLASEVGLGKVYIKNNEVIDVRWLNEKNGLSSSQFFALEINNKSEVLACSAVGIDKISTALSSTNTIQNLIHFDDNDGFNGRECVSDASCKLNDGSIWFGTINGVYKYDEEKDHQLVIPPKLQLTNIRLRYENQDQWDLKSGNYRNIINKKDPVFYYHQNHLTFDFVGISMVNHHKMRYSYYLEGFDDEWLNKTNQTSVTYPNISPGKYTFHIKVYNADGIESEIISYSFSIATPFWDTYWFYFIIIGTVIFILILFVKVRERQLKLINIRLEKKVDKRTFELKQEKIKVEKQHNEITKSINYAKRIQYSILPEENLMKEYFKDYFVLYKPKDIVGGDFYWYRCFGNLSVIATVDCTGHGVPGGFMSMMGSLLLDKIIQIDNLNTSNILIELHKEITRVLDQNSGGEIQDGMDIALCLIDKEKRKLHFSGARNGIILFSNGEIKRHDADLYSVGGSFSNKSKEMKREFKSAEIHLNEDDWVFMYTDGYYDQLGGETITSLGMENFENILKDCISNGKDKNQYIIKEFESWKGDLPQIDDVLVLGFQV